MPFLGAGRMKRRLLGPRHGWGRPLLHPIHGFDDVLGKKVILSPWIPTPFSRACDGKNHASLASDAFLKHPSTKLPRYRTPNLACLREEERLRVLAAFSPLRHYKGGSKEKSPGREGGGDRSAESPARSTSGPAVPDEVVYHGPLSTTLRSVKLLSLSTCCLSVTLGPFVTFFTLPGTSVLSKGIVASVMVVFSASTTSLLHWFTSPYIHKLVWRRNSDVVQVETLSWLSTRVEKELKLSDVRPVQTNRPLANFSVLDDVYYVDEESFPDKQLFKRLVK